MSENATNARTTELVCYAVQAEPLQPATAILHDSPFVTQLLAGAADLPNMPQRRRSDRAGPLAAYQFQPPLNGLTRRIA